VPKTTLRALRFDFADFQEGLTMAKSQKKSNREVRKPKAEKPPKGNASNPSSKPGVVGIVTLKS
jgi:hypothetical protein